MLWAAVAVLWAASLYRITLSVRRPRTVWRTAFTVGVTAPALACTVYVLRRQLDGFTGVWNLANLGTHLVFTAGVVSTQIYVETLYRTNVRPRVLRRHVAVGLTTAAVLLLTWGLSPIHNRFYDDLAPLAADHLSVVAYNLCFYLFLVWGLTRVTYLCFARGIRRKDPTRTVSLVLTGSACAGGVLALLCWSSSFVSGFLGHPTAALSNWGDALLPITLATFGAGILTLLVAPWVVELARCHLHLRTLMPLWIHLTRRWPEVRLDVPPSGDPLTRARYREQRTIIEIQDALRLEGLEEAQADTPPQIGHLLHLARTRAFRGSAG